MTTLRFMALSDKEVDRYRSGGGDAHGQTPERRVSDGTGAPCRYCLDDVEKNAPFLILAHRPFATAQPYAETGPIFIHAESCERYPETDRTPAMFLKRNMMLIRGYDRDDRIVYGTGASIATKEIAQKAAELLTRPEIAYCHLRSAGYNCYQCRIVRA